MFRSNLSVVALMLAGTHALAASSVFCPQGTRVETEVTVTVHVTEIDTESRIYGATEFYGSNCYPYVTVIQGYDGFPPTPDHPAEVIPPYPVGTLVKVETPWMDIPGNPARQARRITELERTTDGGCTWASCASPSWDRTGNRAETRVRSRPGSLGGNDES